jgi:hypothetical protein
MNNSTNNFYIINNNILFFYLLMMFLVLTLSGCMNKNNELPPVAFNTPFTFNTIFINNTSKFSVSITNTGKEDIQLRYLQIPCDCLSDYKCNFRILKSGCSDSITFTYRPFRTGYIEEHVFAYFVGYSKPIHLLIKGRVLEKK